MNYARIIDNIIELAHDKLNEWEMGFIDDIQTKYANNYDRLTTKQKEMILKIQTRHLKY